MSKRLGKSIVLVTDSGFCKNCKSAKKCRLKSKNGKPFGYSLLIDLYGCKKSICDDMNDTYEFLQKLVEFLKMHKQSEPAVVRTDHVKYPTKRGLSAWVPLVESGIQVHTLTVKNFITLDIYSCREFDRRLVGGWVKRWFGASDAETHFILRGTKYSKIKPER